MQEMTIHLPVNVKAILTSNLKEQLKKEMQETLTNVDLELQQLEFQAKRMIAEQVKVNPQELPNLHAHIDSEKLKRLELQKYTSEQLEHLEKLDIGAEIPRGTIDRVLTVKIGDNLHDYVGAEILLEDGKIVAFRM